MENMKKLNKIIVHHKNIDPQNSQTTFVKPGSKTGFHNDTLS